MISEAARRVAEQLAGALVPAVLTPMDARGRPHRRELERYAEAVCASDVGGVAVWAHTGRGPRLTEAARRAVLTTFRERCRGLVIAGIGSQAPDSIAACLRQAEVAVAGGADALMVFPPPGDGQDRVAAAVASHRALADRFDVPLLLFSLYEAAGGLVYPPSLLRELLSIPQVAGIKMATLDSAMACQDTTALVTREFPDRIVLSGEDRMFGPSLTWGARGALVGIAAAAIDVSASVVRAWRRGDAGAFLDSSRRLDRFAMATFRAPMEGYVQRMLWVAQWEGLIDAEAAHDPFGPPLSPTDRAVVREAFDELFPQR